MHSMTGFGKGHADSENYRLAIEVKSINNRFKEIRVRPNQTYNQFEQVIRKGINRRFARGSFDITLSVERLNNNSFSINDIDEKKVLGFLAWAQKMSVDSKVTLNINAHEFLNSEFKAESLWAKDTQSFSALIEESLTKAMVELEKSRQVEGEKLKTEILGHFQKYKENYQKIGPWFQEAQKNLKEQFQEKFNQINSEGDWDESRFHQELFYYLEKLDIAEELARIESHLDKLTDTFELKSEKGRKIEFYLQELLRETNTIGSKSQSKEISNSVVEMKVNIEKMKEQSLNIE